MGVDGGVDGGAEDVTSASWLRGSRQSFSTCSSWCISSDASRFSASPHTSIIFLRYPIHTYTRAQNAHTPARDQGQRKGLKTAKHISPSLSHQQVWQMISMDGNLPLCLLEADCGSFSSPSCLDNRVKREDSLLWGGRMVRHKPLSTSPFHSGNTQVFATEKKNGEISCWYFLKQGAVVSF